MFGQEVNQDSLEQEIDNLKNRMEADKPPMWIIIISGVSLGGALILTLFLNFYGRPHQIVGEDTADKIIELAFVLLYIFTGGLAVLKSKYHVFEKLEKYYDITNLLYARSAGIFNQFIIPRPEESDDSLMDRFAYVVGDVYQVGISEEGIPAAVYYEKQNPFQFRKKDEAIQEFDLEINFGRQSIEPGPSKFSGCAFEFEKDTGLNQSVYVYLGDWYPVEKMEETMEEITFDSVMGSQEDMSQQFRAFAEDATEAMSVLDYEWFWTMSEFCKEHPVRMAICYRPESICVAVSGKKDLFQIAYGTPEEEIRAKVDDVYGLLCKLTEAVMLTDEMESDNPMIDMKEKTNG